MSGGIVIRTEINPSVASGHAMRCVSLGAALRERCDGPVRLVCEADPMISSLAETHGLGFEGLAAGVLPVDSRDALRIGEMEPDLVLLDSPKATQAWVDMVRGSGAKVAYLTGSPGPAPLIGTDMCFWPEICPHQAPAHLDLHCGLEFVILGPAYWKAAPRLREGAIHRVLITTGGADHYNLSALTLRALNAVFESRIEITVVVGAFFKHPEAIADAAKDSHHKVFLADRPAGLSTFLEQVDLVISGGGGTLYEMARLGVPGIGVAIWPLQAPAVDAMEAAGAITGITWVDPETTAREISKALHFFRGNPEVGTEMSRKGPEVIDGQGAFRIADKLLKLTRNGNVKT